MKRIVTFALTVMAAAVACTKNEELPEHFQDVEEVERMSFRASFAETRTSLQADGSVFWSPSDSIAVFPIVDTASPDAACFTTDTDSPSLNAEFFGSCRKADRFIALYPYSTEACVIRNAGDFKVFASVPSVQEATEGSFSPKAFPSVAFTDTNILKFKNICGGSKIRVSRSDITSIEFRSCGGEAVCGDAYAGMVSGIPQCDIVTGYGSVVLTAPAGGCFKKGENYYMSMFPGSLKSGFELIFHTANSSAVYEYKDSVIIHRSVFGRLYDLDRDLVFKSSGGEDECLCFTAEQSGVRLAMSRTIVKSVAKEADLMFSIDGATWFKLKVGDGEGGVSDSTVIVLDDIGDKVYVKAGSEGNLALAQAPDLYNYFTASGDVKVAGNIMSLLNGDNPADSLTAGNRHAFCNLFANMKTLTDASNLKLGAGKLSLNCYNSMFSGCSSLVKGPDLPATTLKNGCYSSMFSGCTSLKTAPEISAVELAEYCCSSMFSGCTNLQKAPALPAAVMQKHCYSAMFSGCTNLKVCPELSATQLAGECYQSMFEGCTSLEKAPDLPAAGLEWGCYCGMFSGCIGLKNAPELPAVTVASTCYHSMFKGCTGLTAAPDLPATVLEMMCYCCMFQGCAQLKTVPDLNATKMADMCCYEMFEGCTALQMAPSLPATTLAEDCYYGMFMGCTGLKETPSLPATTLAEDCYAKMFMGCTGLKETPVLPATRLAKRCYSGMFEGCTGLTRTTKLSATTLAEDCYGAMFRDCTGLSEAPELPAIGMKTGCYSCMFMGCTGLSKGPKLPATTMAQDCYAAMFEGCTGLVEAPSLPATKLANWCYYAMFEDCTALKEAPALPAMQLCPECYQQMFDGCAALESAPVLPALVLKDQCYMMMFHDCSRLGYIKMDAVDISARSCLYKWVEGVSPSGIFVKNQEAEWNIRGVDGIPEGWTVRN